MNQIIENYIKKANEKEKHMEMLQFYCPYCGKKWFGLKKYNGLEVTCPGCRQSFKALITSEPPPPTMYTMQVEDSPKLKKLREQLAQERKRLQEQEEKKKKWEQIKEEKRRQEKKKSPWDGAFWEVTGEILFGVMVLVLFVPIAIIYVGCLAFGGGRR